jgi:hypothetical protein
MQFEGVFRGQVVDLGSPFNTVVPKGKGAVGFLHVFPYSFLDQSNIEFGFVCPRVSFLENSQRGTDLLAKPFESM